MNIPITKHLAHSIKNNHMNNFTIIKYDNKPPTQFFLMTSNELLHYNNKQRNNNGILIDQISFTNQILLNLIHILNKHDN